MLSTIRHTRIIYKLIFVTTCQLRTPEKFIDTESIEFSNKENEGVVVFLLLNLEISVGSDRRLTYVLNPKIHGVSIGPIT